jgi:hypothetical protein
LVGRQGQGLGRSRGLIVAASLLACIGTVGAQSFNIDMEALAGGPGVGQGQPSPQFGGASQQNGMWDGIDSSGPWLPVALNGLNGLPTAATMFATGGIGAGCGYNLAGLRGDFALLMKDFADVGGEIDYHFSGFRPGRYFVYCYAANPAVQTPVDVSVTVPGSVIPIQHLTGPMPMNQFILGTTHTVHEITITGDSFEIDVTGPLHNTRVNGFQVVEVVPEPATILALSAGAIYLAMRKAV